MKLDRRTLIATAAASLFWPGVSSATDPKRFGLVIGNNAYPNKIGKLNNAANDARLIANVLRQCGFNIPNDAVVIDANKSTMELRIRAHSNRVAAAGANALGFVYYAGHGAARQGGDNYLIPLMDGTIAVDTPSIWDQSVKMEWLLSDALANIKGAQVVAIDACRNELRVAERSIGGSGSLAVRGLNVVSDGGNANLFMSFSTWQGQTASDGGADQKNGPYALALANTLRKPGPILNVFDKVRREVMKLTQQRQEVMNVSRLSDESSDLQIGGNVNPATVPPLPVTIAAATNRGIGVPVNVALCISCSYAGTRAPLPNARGDALKVAKALEASDFAVDTLVDPGKAAMRTAVANFKKRLDDAQGTAVGVLYFAGHSAGMHSVGNVLLQNGPIPDAGDAFAEEGYRLGEILNELDSANTEAVVIFVDGCRPLDLDKTYGKSLATGLVAQNRRGRVLVGFSAAASRFALPGPDASLYADALAQEIMRPDRRELGDVMRSVSQKVSAKSRGKMRPTYVTNAPIYFRDGRGLVELKFQAFTP